MLDKAAFLPFGFRRWLTRTSDGYLGPGRGQRSRNGRDPTSSVTAITASPASARSGGQTFFSRCTRILPPCAGCSPKRWRAIPNPPRRCKLEWELSLPQADFAHLVEETRMAKHASSRPRVLPATVWWSTGQTPLQSVWCRTASISTVFIQSPEGHAGRPATPLQLLFVGRINQRKGLRYLLRSLTAAGSRNGGAHHLWSCARQRADEWKQCNFAVQSAPLCQR